MNLQGRGNHGTVANFTAGTETVIACADLDPNRPLLETRIAGFPFYTGELYWRDIPEEAPLDLCREPDHPDNSWAVAVLWQGHKLGYLPRQHDFIAARLLDDGIPLRCRVLEKLTLPGDWHNLWIRVDFA